MYSGIHEWDMKTHLQKSRSFSTTNSRVLRACWHCDRDVGKQDDLENWGLARYSTTQALHQLLIIHKHDWNVFFLFFVLVWRGKKVRLQSSPGIFTMVEALNSILLKSPDCLWVSLFFFFFQMSRCKRGHDQRRTLTASALYHSICFPSRAQPARLAVHRDYMRTRL